MSWPAAANIGPNPTFGEDARKVEVHLIGYAGGELYGQQVTVDFLARLRDTQRFESVEQLRAQLREDVERAGELVAKNVAP
jgi:riboflavin kinase/FMN adenylyltransferase